MSAKKPTLKQVHDRSRVLSVFGPFNAYTLVMMPTDLATGLFGSLADKARPDVVEAVETDLAKLPEVVSGSALAQTALALAYEIQDPYNSATSKSMCAAKLMEAMATLRVIAPPEEKKDDLDDLAAQRKKRIRDRARGRSAPKASSRP